MVSAARRVEKVAESTPPRENRARWGPQQGVSPGKMRGNAEHRRGGTKMRILCDLMARL
jgi:hypothetical protein